MHGSATYHPTQGERNSSVELLRIISMLLIVLSHACVHSGFDSNLRGLALNSLFIRWGVLGNLGVDVLIMITGYYSSRKKYDLRSLVKLFPQVWFYSISLFVVGLLLGHEYTVKGYLQAFFPTVFREYWYFTAYAFIIFLSPFINLFLQKTGIHAVKRILVASLLLLSVIPTACLIPLYGGALAEFAFLIVLYLIGAYFRLGPHRIFRNGTIRKILVTMSFLLLFAFTLILEFRHAADFSTEINTGLLYNRNSLLIVCCAVGMLAMAFLGKPFYNKTINTIGSCTFGVYLIHENPAIRTLLWEQICKHAQYQASPLLTARIIASVVVVFAVCLGIEYLRKKYLEKGLLKIVTPTVEWALAILEKIMGPILQLEEKMLVCIFKRGPDGKC